MNDPRYYEWPAPWEPVTDRQLLENELRRELSPAHELYGKVTNAIARRHDNDDVLFAIGDDAYAIVHLTWSGSPEHEPFPAVTLFRSIAEAISQNQISD